MKYRTKLKVLFAAFSSVMLLFVISAATTNYQEAKERVKSRLSSDSLLISEWIRAQTENAGFLLNGINVQIPQAEIETPITQTSALVERKQFLDSQAELLPSASLIGVYDGNCQLLQSNFAISFDANNREYCQLVQDAPLNTHVVTNSFITTQGKPNIAVARSFDLNQGDLQGFSVVSFDLSFFSALIDKLEYEPTSLVAIFDENMVLLGRFPSIPDVVGTYVQQPDAESFLQQSDQQTTYLEVTSPVDGVHRLYILRKVEDLPFLIVIGLTNDTWSLGYRARLLTMVFLTILLLVFGYIALRSNLSIHRQSALLKVMKENAERDARIDPLTGLDNRRSFYEIGELEFGRHQRYEVDLCLLILDLDHFKKVNDNFGHVVGDKALIKVAESIAKTLRASDYSFRLGGEEFAIMLPETNLAQARVFAERLRLTIEDESTRDPIVPVCTASIGLCQASLEVESFQSLVKKADAAMYEAKEQGRNQVVATQAVAKNTITEPESINLTE